MIKTASFTINTPFEQFKACLSDYYDDHKISYNKDILEKNANKLWNEYGNDVLSHIEGTFAPEVSISWDLDSDIDIYAGLLKQYLIETKCETQNFPGWSMSFEEYWKDLMKDAMEENAASLYSKVK